MPNRKRVIVCFDGLSHEQFLGIAADMPVLSTLLKTGSIAELDSTPFVDAQPIWAEILTGEPWYRNGCAGFGRPTRSLNHLEISSESTLKVPVRLNRASDGDSATGGSDIFINVPLIQPRDGERLWLSDGGTPSARVVSPSSLAEQSLFKSYAPRPHISMGDALSNTKDSIAEFIDSELQRLECAKKLTETENWKFCLYRTSVFDQLAHLLGPAFLSQQKLAVSAKIKALLQALDNTLAPLMMLATDRMVLSTFSHVRCKGLFSINTALEKARLLARTYPTKESENLRLQALAATQKAGDEAAQPITVRKQLQYVPRKTLCASPSRGTIYLNSLNRFEDGGDIDEFGIAKEEARIAEFFAETTKPLYKSATLFKNPKSQLGGPNFVFQIDGIELVETLGTAAIMDDLPTSTHASKGFIWSQKIDCNGKYCSTDVVNCI